MFPNLCRRVIEQRKKQETLRKGVSLYNSKIQRSLDACVWNGRSARSWRSRERDAFECSNALIIGEKILQIRDIEKIIGSIVIAFQMILLGRSNIRRIWGRHTGVILSSCFFLGFKTSSGLPSTLDTNIFTVISILGPYIIQKNDQAIYNSKK